ncbi:hypothetical protein DL93DRAFT_2234693 [Clavulina sp. PMI_390]|nr:hypothetical protein DL93DRAFT_2234693 [Clavulina sp. PMI_390]
MTRRQTARETPQIYREPIPALPDEILIVIFELAVQQANLQSAMAIILSHVCTRWRIVAIDCTIFWGYLTIFSRRNLPLIPIFANRSRHRRLHLTIDIACSPRKRSLSTPNKPLIILPLFASKLSTLTILSSNEFELLTAGHQALEGLDLQKLTIDTSRRKDKCAEHISPMPLLLRSRCLRLTNVCVAPSCETHHSSLVEEFQFTVGVGFSTYSFYGTIGNLPMPKLRRLVLQGVHITPILERWTALEFPLLESIELNYCYNTLPGLIGTYILAPSLLSIKIRRETDLWTRLSGLEMKQMVWRPIHSIQGSKTCTYKSTTYQNLY